MYAAALDHPTQHSSQAAALLSTALLPPLTPPLPCWCAGGKTEIARRLAKVADAPFIKVEATKFTEIGFHGRDVDSIISDLVRVSISQMKGKKRRLLRERIRERVEAKILDALTGPGGGARADFLHLLRQNLLDQQEVEIEIPVKQSGGGGAGVGGVGGGGGLGSAQSEESVSPPSNERVLEFALRGLTGGSALKGRKELRKLLISEARPLLEEAEYDAALSQEDVTKEAIKAVEEDGIVFLDEVDKICSPASSYRYADASAEGVQRDLLPLLEGTTVTTKHGDVKTDHILFIASGAFHAVKPSDMLAELQGRLPIRVELKGLTQDEMYTILTQTENNLIQQQVQLMAVSVDTTTPPTRSRRAQHDNEDEEEHSWRGVHPPCSPHCLLCPRRVACVGGGALCCAVLGSPVTEFVCRSLTRPSARSPEVRQRSALLPLLSSALLPSRRLTSPLLLCVLSSAALRQWLRM